MKLKDARNQRRLFIYVNGANKVIINVDKISCIEHKDNTTKIFYQTGTIISDDENYELFNKFGNLLVNDFVEAKAEKEQA